MVEGIQFEEDEQQKRLIYSQMEASNKQSKLIEWVLQKGLAKDKQHAIKILLGGAILIFLISLFFLFSGSSGEDIPSRALDNPDYGYNPNET